MAKKTGTRGRATSKKIMRKDRKLKAITEFFQSCISTIACWNSTKATTGPIVLMKAD